jgi:DNA-binding response OmpR family regulator
MKILVVDDETAIVTTVQAYFVREGYEVKSALEGRQALSIARTFRPDNRS